MYCLDTNIIIAIFRGDMDLLKKLDSVEPEKIHLTVITLCELFKGAYRSRQKERDLVLVEKFAANYKILGLSIACCDIFGRDFVELRRLGRLTSDFDLLISSIAKENDLILVTRNKKDFENIPDLKLEEW